MRHHRVLWSCPALLTRHLHLIIQPVELAGKRLCERPGLTVRSGTILVGEYHEFLLAVEVIIECLYLHSFRYH